MDIMYIYTRVPTASNENLLSHLVLLQALFFPASVTVKINACQSEN